MKVGDLVEVNSSFTFGRSRNRLAIITKVKQTVNDKGYVPDPNNYACNIIFLHAPHEIVAVFESEIETVN